MDIDTLYRAYLLNFFTVDFEDFIDMEVMSKEEFTVWYKTEQEGV